MGNAGEYLSINPSTGEIHVSVDDAFDYHRQNELFVQVSNTYDSWLVKGKKLLWIGMLHSELQFSYSLGIVHFLNRVWTHKKRAKMNKYLLSS